MAELYAGPIVDAHQHFWEPDRGRHPRLRPEARIPFRYGDYGSLKRRYLPPDYRAYAGHRIAQSVYVETEWDPADPIDETRYASGLAARYGLPSAIVAQAWLDRDDAAEILAAQAAFPLVRGVRHKPDGTSAPGAPGRTLMSSPAWRAGFGLLARYGLHFDLQTPWWHLAEAAELAADFPATTILLNHAGLPAERDDASLMAWREAMARVARRPNVAVKISGLGWPGRAWTPEANGWIVRTAIDLFGPERAMFGSNFPVDGLCASLQVILDGMTRIVAPLPRAAQDAFFHGTAQRLYRPDAGPA